MLEPLGSEDVTLTTYAAGSRGTDGRFTPGAASTSTIRASVQPAAGDDLLTLPEGERQRVGIKAYTKSVVAVGDRLTVDSEVFEVRSVARQRSVLPHYKVLALRVDPVEVDLEPEEP